MTAVVLHAFVGMVSWVSPIYSRIICRVINSCPFIYVVPIYISFKNPIMLLMIIETVKIGPSMVRLTIGVLEGSPENNLRKKWTPVQLWEWGWEV